MLPEGERRSTPLEPWGSAQLAETRMLPPSTNGSFLVNKASGHAVTPVAQLELN